MHRDAKVLEKQEAEMRKTERIMEWIVAVQAVLAAVGLTVLKNLLF